MEDPQRNRSIFVTPMTGGARLLVGLLGTRTKASSSCPMPPRKPRKQPDHLPLPSGERDVKLSGESEDPAPPPPDGAIAELRERYKLCSLDLDSARRYPSKTISSALFLFFATLFSTVALGAHIQQETANRIGLSEYLLRVTDGLRTRA